MQITYRCEAATLEGFVQQLAVAYVARGYHFYVTGRVPVRLLPQEHDERMLAKFDVAHSKHARYRRRQRRGDDGRPLANTQYLRHGSFWVLLATAGSHRFFTEHQQWDTSRQTLTRQYRDVRRQPIVYGGYSISQRRGRTTVRISPRAYRELKQHYLAVALTFSTDSLGQEFKRCPFESYGGVNNQMHAILRAVNRRRKVAGLSPVPREAVRTKRRQRSPFGAPERIQSLVKMEVNDVENRPRRAA